MPYTVTSSEQTTGKAADHETKAMLYLMNFHKNCNDIHFFVVDFFNDITGLDQLAENAWDVQSKASINLTGKAIGRDLVTLYKNFISDLHFTDFILFVGGIKTDGLKNVSLKTFNLDNFTDKYIKSIKSGIKEEALKKTYIKEHQITDEIIEDFLNKVTFVINNKSKSEYIKEITKINSTKIVKDAYLECIFDQIRDIQSSKKNIQCENITINILEDFHKYKKHMTSDQIKMLVLSRLVNKDVGDALPPSFTYMLDGRSDKDRIELQEDCQHSIKRMMFDKNNAKAYWVLFEDIYMAITKNPEANVEDIYSMIDKKLIKNVSSLDFNSARYFIALIKDGLG